jgi:hypothetical protein
MNIARASRRAGAALLIETDAVLRHRRSPLRQASVRRLICIVTIFGLLYGGVMGSAAGFVDGHWLQIVYSAIKMPMLLGVTFALSLPSYFVLNSLAGLRGDFRAALRAVAASQAGVAIVLASLSPFTALWYASTTDYNGRVLFNGVMFALATGAGQAVLHRAYRPLLAVNPRHATLLRSWILVYSFIAIQMAYVLRPFVGQPALPTHFFRPGAWGNAYVVVMRMIWQWIGPHFVN